MLSSRKSTSVQERSYKHLQSERPTSREELRPGEKVEVLDMCGRPTGICCTVQKAEAHAIGVIWGGETVTVGRAWLRKLN
jgi:hypothetical protein